MTDLPGNLLWFIVAISVLVAVHEYGHYIVGRWCGMKVLRFSIGFGKPIKTWYGAAPDRTEYCLASIPLGGYVKFLDEREQQVEPADEGRAFTQKPVWARIAVLLAGPLFNFLFAILAYWFLFVQGVPALKPAVGEVVASSYAADAGLQYGDRILSVGDRKAADWETALVTMIDEMIDNGQIPMTLLAEGGSERQVIINVGDDRTRLTEPGLLFDGLGFSPWQPEVIISSVDEEGASAASGLQAGDVVTGIDDEVIYHYGDLREALVARPDQQIDLYYLRDGAEFVSVITTSSVEVEGQRIGRLGVGITGSYGDLSYNRKFPVVAAVGEAVSKTWETSIFTVKMLGRMATGDVSIRNISGPISIAQYAGNSAARGLDDFIGFLAIISISLGVLNLLPIPILDGGQIVYQAVEGVKGSPLSERSQILGQQVGIFALLILMSFAFYNDFARLFG